MAIFNLPTWSKSSPSQMSFGLRWNTMKFESPLNNTVQTTALPGARWIAKMQFNNLIPEDVRIWKAWLSKMRGMANRFLLYDFVHPIPFGTALGLGQVDGLSQTGYNLITDGWVPNQSGLFLPGDYFGVGNQLCIITQTIDANADGQATLVFEAPLRSSPADDTQIIINKPTCIMMLKDDNQDDFWWETPYSASLTIECMEAFN